MDYFAANDLAAFAIVSGTPIEDTTAAKIDVTYTTKGIGCSASPSVIEAAHLINPDTGAAAPLTDFWIHYERWRNGANTMGEEITFYNSADVAVLRIWAPNGTETNIRMEYWNGAAWVTPAENSGSWPGPTNTKHTFDWHVVCGAGGSIELFGDQTGPLFHVAGLSAAVNNVAYFRVRFAANNTQQLFSQFLVSDESTVGAKIASLVPNANGTYTAWANDYNNLVKVSYNDATLVSSSVLGAKESYGATDAALPANYHVSSVWMNARARLNAAAPVHFKPLLRIAGADYQGAYDYGGLNAAAFGPSTAGFSVDPSTGAGWTIANVNAAELGFVATA